MTVKTQNEGTRPPMHVLAQRAREAARTLALSPAEQRAEALRHIAAGLRNGTEALLAANRQDLEQADVSASFRERLTLTEERLEGMAGGVETLADMEDPVGQILAEWKRPNGLKMRRVAVPFGVLGVIYESRPNVGVDAAGWIGELS